MPVSSRFQGEPAKTPVLSALKEIKEELQGLVALADKQMEEVQAIAKEVGGDPELSPRYYESLEIRGLAKSLLGIITGHYEWMLSARPAADVRAHTL